MIQTRLFKNTFILLVVVGVLNFLAVYLYLYWTVWWFDMLVHFSAGMCVAMAGILLYFFYHSKNIPSIPDSIKVAVLSVLLVGVLWEIYELCIGVASFSDGLGYFMDTGSDLLMDISGGVLGSLYAHRLLK